MQQTTTGAARARRAGPDARRLSHPRLEPNPALVRQAERRAQSVENRIADRMTAFAGSMRFVYIHIAWFSCWIGFGVEHYPYGLLTMIVSLEAIVLSTFVMISQNRADAKRQVIADQQWQTVRKEDRQNEELLEVARQILELTKAMHAETPTRPAGTTDSRTATGSTERGGGSGLAPTSCRFRCANVSPDMGGRRWKRCSTAPRRSRGRRSPRCGGCSACTAWLPSCSA